MKRKLRKIYLTLGLAAFLAALFYQNRLECEEWVVTLPRLPETYDGFRITLLTDLHGAEFGKDNRRLLAAVEAASPDMIAISGDLLDEASDPAILPPLLHGLTAIAPTYYVPGNHEWSREDTKELLKAIEAAGVTVLLNRAVRLDEAGQLYLGGTDDWTSHIEYLEPAALTEKLRRKLDPDACLIMLSHRNNELALWSRENVDLVLCGHGHGGVIRLPGIGGLLSVDRTFFPKDCEGLYHQNGTAQAVSRGLGGLRIWNPPHLPTLILKKP